MDNYAKRSLRFPDGFLWGSATAAYQVEGGIENNDWARAAKEGKVPVCGMACDHYNNFEDDFDTVQKLDQKAHRISIEWSRIEPEKGVFNENEIKHYRDVIRALKRRGITPFVTLWHFTLPTWVADIGGFQNIDTVGHFVRYCQYTIEKLGEECDGVYFMTMNEPMVYVGNGYLVGKWPPFLKGGYLPCLRVIKNLVTSHNESYRAIKKIKKNVVVVGIAKNNMYFHATTRNPLHRLSAAFMGWFWNKRFLGKIAHHLDFIGLNYYVHRAVGPSRQHEKSDMGWDIYPEGIYHVLKELARFERPIYVTENGIADEGDSKRKGFIIDHLRYVHKAIEEGVGVHGYFYWSLMDNYEWAEGFSRRFGLLEVDYSTKRRKMRESAFAYKEICGNNSITI